MKEDFEADWVRVFDGSEPASKLATTALGSASPVIVKNADAYRLLDFERFIWKRREGDPLNALDGEILPIVGEAEHPLASPSRIASVLQTMPGGMALGMIAETATGPYAVIYHDANSNFRKMVKQRWKCDRFGERYVQSSGGPCPRHQGASLVRVP